MKSYPFLRDFWGWRRVISEDHLDLGSEKQVIIIREDDMALLKNNYEIEILMICTYLVKL